MPNETGAVSLGKPWKTSLQDLSDKEEETQSTIYVGLCWARKEVLMIAALISRKSVETLSLGL